MNKQKILSEIQRIAAENDGKAPGWQRFATETGIRKSDWYPNLWLRWSDAIREGGCQHNAFCSAHESNFLIAKYIELIRGLAIFQLKASLRLRETLIMTSQVAVLSLSLGQSRIACRK